MAGEWQQPVVGDLISTGVLQINDGYRMTNSQLSSAGIPFVRAGDIRDGVVSLETDDFLDLSLASDASKKLVRPGDVAFIAKGTVGRVGRVLPGSPSFVVAPQVCFWRSLRPEVLDPGFLYYYLCSREFQNALDAVKTHGSMVADYVSLADQRQFRLRLPPLVAQRAIARILGALDDKIELNRRMNETLEQMARALFKSWFVDFDPVRAKAEGRHPDGLDPATAALFPSRLVDSPLGPIPEGWSVAALEEHASFVKGVSYRSHELSQSGTALVNLKNFRRGGGFRRDGLKEYTGEFAPAQSLSAGDIIISQTDVTQNADVIGRAARVPSGLPYAVLVASLDVLIVRPLRETLSREYLLGRVRLFLDDDLRPHETTRRLGLERPWEAGCEAGRARLA